MSRDSQKRKPASTAPRVKPEVKTKPDVTSDLAGLFERRGTLAPIAQQTSKTSNAALPAVETTSTRTTPLAEPPAYVPQVDPSTQAAFTRTQTAVAPAKTRVAHRKNDRTPWLLIIPALGLLAYALNSPTVESGNSLGTGGPAMSEAEMDQRVQTHRKLTGWKLNRERAGTEIENVLSAPAIAPDAARVQGPDIMSGVPLQAEANRPERDERTTPVDPDYPDARIMYGLQEEQDKNEWDRRAEALYVKEFIANAARAGYKVSVAADGRITVLRAPPGVAPGAALPPSLEGRSPGAAR